MIGVKRVDKLVELTLVATDVSCSASLTPVVARQLANALMMHAAAIDGEKAQYDSDASLIRGVR